jgi:hypothetical protein
LRIAFNSLSVHFHVGLEEGVPLRKDVAAHRVRVDDLIAVVPPGAVNGLALRKISFAL